MLTKIRRAYWSYRNRFLPPQPHGVDFDLGRTKEILSKYLDGGHAIYDLNYGKEAFRDLKKLGFEKFAHGVYKYAFIHRNWVVKVSRGRYNTVHHEWDLWLRAQERNTGHFYVPTIKDEQLLIQKRCDPDPIKYATHKEVIERTAWDCTVGDLHDENVGWEGDRFVFIDFM